MLPRYSSSLLIISLACAVLLPIDRQSLSTTSSPNASSLTLPDSSILVGDEECFNPSTDPRLIPAQIVDCLHAALQLSEKGSIFRPILFTRRRTKGFFQLPQVFRAGTCVISVDVNHDLDEDKFTLWTAHKGALDLSMKCVGGSPHLGGKTFIGPKKVVYVLVFGRNPALELTHGIWSK